MQFVFFVYGGYEGSFERSAFHEKLRLDGGKDGF